MAQLVPVITDPAEVAEVSRGWSKDLLITIITWTFAILGKLARS